MGSRPEVNNEQRPWPTGWKGVLVGGLLPFLAVVALLALPAGWAWAREGQPQGQPVVHILYFYSVDCPHCQVVEREVLAPLEEQYGERLDLRRLEIGKTANYELLVRTEEFFDLAPEARGLPALVIDGQVLIGEEQIRQELPCLLESCLAAGGTQWPPIPGLEAAIEGAAAGAGTAPMVPEGGIETGSGVICQEEAAAACESEAPIWAAYFYQVGCQECSRAEADIRYIRSRYPRLVVEEFNIYDDAALAQWLARRAGRDDLHTPALFIGDDALIGEGEITPQNLEALLEKYGPGGAGKVWAEFNPESGLADIVERFRALGPLTVVLAGLVDGLNPCAFATLVFFVAYLAANGRKGREVLLVGAAFSAGVFLAYLAVGLGLYKVLGLLGDALTTLGRWVYGLTAALCAALAVVSFLDFLKARRGQIEGLSLSLPASLRGRARAVVRQGQRASAYGVAALITGLVVSLLELACTGQVYLPTIVFVAGIPAMRSRAIGYLVLYNLVFILPLLVVFVLACFGTTSLELGLFLRRRMAAVRLGTAAVFLLMALWLALSLV